MTTWRTYADPPQSDPSLGRDQRRESARALRDEIDFAQALRTSGTGYVVWMCADALDAVAGPTGVVLDAAHVDDCLPGPWEADLIDLALRQDMGARAVEAMAEGYQQGVAAIAAEPLHSARTEALRRSRRLADGVEADGAQSPNTAARRLVAPGARLRRDRVEARWGCAVGDVGDLGSEVAQYRESLPEADARLLAQYRVADALVGEDGHLLVLLARGSDSDDVLLLEAAPALPSTREDSFGAWRDGSDVQRVLLAREAVPLVPAEFAGWSTSADGAVARVWSRARAATERPDLGGRRARARRLGVTLGMLHAANSDAVSLAGYLGHSRRFPAAVRDAVREARGH
ncbi:MAG: hypothetical protein RL134_2175 [Actinomycetota bacterium]|jgi:hypothetical protein